MPLATTRAGDLRPRYGFRKRIALRVAAGMDTNTIAGIERAAPAAIRRLPGERSLQKLILHHEERARLDRPMREAALRRLDGGRAVAPALPRRPPDKRVGPGGPLPSRPFCLTWRRTPA